MSQWDLMLDALATSLLALPPDAAQRLSVVPSTQVLIFHGRDDQIVPIAKSREAESILRAHAIPVELIVFDGGHYCYTRPFFQGCYRHCRERIWTKCRPGRRIPILLLWEGDRFAPFFR